METVNTILKMMGMHVSPRALDEIIHEIDEDDSGTLEFPEFVQLAAKFLIEEDEEQMRWELKEAFRIYDKQGKNQFGFFRLSKNAPNIILRQRIHHNEHPEGNSEGEKE